MDGRVMQAYNNMESITLFHDKELVNNHNHTNGIEGFWSFAKERFHKYHGISKTNYPLYIKEMEFRFNHRNENVYNLLIDICVVRRAV